MTLYYRLNKNNDIIDYSPFNYSEDCLSTEKNIVSGIDGFYYFEGSEPQPLLDDVKIAKISQINSTYESKSAVVRADTPNDEVLTWTVQKTEAEAFAFDNKALTPFIDGLATARQVDRVTLINKVLEKTTAYNSYMAELTGLRQYYEDLVKKATTVEEVEKITW